MEGAPPRPSGPRAPGGPHARRCSGGGAPRPPGRPSSTSTTEADAAGRCRRCRRRRRRRSTAQPRRRRRRPAERSPVVAPAAGGRGPAGQRRRRPRARRRSLRLHVAAELRRRRLRVRSPRRFGRVDGVRARSVGSLRLGEEQSNATRDGTPGTRTLVVCYCPVLSRGSTASVPALRAAPGAGGQPTALDRWTASGRRARPPPAGAGSPKDGLRPPEGNLMPEEQHAKMLERRRDVWRGQTAKAGRRAKDEQREAFRTQTSGQNTCQTFTATASLRTGHPSGSTP